MQLFHYLIPNSYRGPIPFSLKGKKEDEEGAKDDSDSLNNVEEEPEGESEDGTSICDEDEGSSGGYVDSNEGDHDFMKLDAAASSLQWSNKL